MKTCGTREYRCDCGTLFSRRDSFITHRAFCDALAQESARAQPSQGGDLKVEFVAPPPAAAAASPPPPPLTPSTGVLSPVLSIQSSAELPENQNAQLPPPPLPQPLTTSTAPATMTSTMATATVATNTSSSTSSGGVFASILNPSTSQLSQSTQQPSSSYSSGLLCSMAGPDQTTVDPVSLSLSSSLFSTSPLFSPTSQNPQPHYVSRSQPALSATALLQKAAEMGATSSNSSFLRGLGLALSSQDNTSTMSSTSTSTGVHDWNNNRSLSSGLGLGLRSSGPSSYNELMMSPSTLFGNKPTTLDFLGLGMGAGETSSGGFSAFLNSIGGGLNMTTTSFSGDAWDDSADRKPSLL
ncbi:hypothetical protein CDL12_29322 [Handroanthus impetiginosus]|uniref:BIRD-IDD transcription factor fourth C2HC zinc finger domain-containing protein n=1 Tax=Handroanthus impetiginosus TaxID=429701 RepID=A0A2G9FZ38_9LAMI|nr:hypothetical protein CDL12_29322 [Handroanthus impetiginosus]